MWNKNCPKCNKQRIIKNGRKYWRQAYKCTICGHKFVSQSRIKKIKAKNLREEYSSWKQTYEQLAIDNWCSSKTIQRVFDKHVEVEEVFYNKNLAPRPSYFVTDVSWFGENLAVIMIKSCCYKKVIYAKVIDTECIEEYAIGIDFIEQNWWKVLWITSDWFKWLRKLFSCYVYQFCQFHQLKLITMYLTRKPILEPSKELRKIALDLKNSDYYNIKLKLDIWFAKYWDFLKEKSYSDMWKWWYTHKRLRSAHNSLKNNLDVLFTYQDHLWMQNTTNMLEWYFRPLKAKIWVHCWLSRDRKIKLLFKLLTS